MTRFIAGSGLGGGPLSAAMVMLAYDRWGIFFDLLYVRKEAKDHGSQRQVEPATDILTIRQRNTVLVEDVITTGNSAIAAANALQQEGYSVLGILSLVDRLEGGTENINRAGYAVSSVFTRDDILSDA